MEATQDSGKASDPEPLQIDDPVEGRRHEPADFAIDRQSDGSYPDDDASPLFIG